MYFLQFLGGLNQEKKKFSDITGLNFRFGYCWIKKIWGHPYFTSCSADLGFKFVNFLFYFFRIFSR